MTLAKILKRGREDRGLSQRELARLAGVSPSTISRFESGAMRPAYPTLLRLSRALRLPFIVPHFDRPDPPLSDDATGGAPPLVIGE